MNKLEQEKDMNLLQNYIIRLTMAEDKKEADKIMKMCKAKLKELYNDTLQIIKGA